tara:strand:- start:398 stop:505 length:108 start_codon:yes stop_codon:yes gene_type:complete
MEGLNWMMGGMTFAAGLTQIVLVLVIAALIKHLRG